jgi:hypothetical protein
VLGRRLLDQARVLSGEAEAERGLEVAVGDGLALDPQVGQVERTALDRLQQRGRVQSQPLGQSEALGAGLGHGQHPGVSDQFQPTAVAGLADPDGARPDGVEHGLDLVPQASGAGGQDDELALLRGLLGADHRGVDETHPPAARQDRRIDRYRPRRSCSSAAIRRVRAWPPGRPESSGSSAASADLPCHGCPSAATPASGPYTSGVCGAGWGGVTALGRARIGGVSTCRVRIGRVRMGLGKIGRARTGRSGSRRLSTERAGSRRTG